MEEELIQVKAKSRQDTHNYPAKLNLKIGGLAIRQKKREARAELCRAAATIG